MGDTAAECWTVPDTAPRREEQEPGPPDARAESHRGGARGCSVPWTGQTRDVGTPLRDDPVSGPAPPLGPQALLLVPSRNSTSLLGAGSPSSLVPAASSFLLPPSFLVPASSFPPASLPSFLPASSFSSSFLSFLPPSFFLLPFFPPPSLPPWVRKERRADGVTGEVGSTLRGAPAAGRDACAGWGMW